MQEILQSGGNSDFTGRIKRIAVLYGGRSNEREISIRSGVRVVRSLKNLGYEVVEIDTSDDPYEWIQRLRDVDLVFLALHGENGEDGRIQGLLDILGKKYVSSSAYASFLSFDKYLTYLFLKDAGLKVPDTILIGYPISFSPFGFPVFLKPRWGGSSIGVVKVNDSKQMLEESKKLILEYGQIIVQRYVGGVEITVSVVEKNEKPFVLPILELVPKREFYDYVAKYTEGMTDLIVPARISKKEEIMVKNIARMIFKLMGCSGLARIDGKIENGCFYVFEVNTIPGLTELSDLPASARALGWDMDELIRNLIGEVGK